MYVICDCYFIQSKLVGMTHVTCLPKNKKTHTRNTRMNVVWPMRVHIPPAWVLSSCVAPSSRVCMHSHGC